jgi:hypothetical protein
MMEDLVGEATSSPAVEAPSAPALDTLVGEGKKYASTELLAESRLKADEHIGTLEAENANMKEKLQSLEASAAEAATISSVLDAINSKPTGQEANNQGASNPEDITRLIDERLSTTRANEVSEANRASVNQNLSAHFNGDATKAKEYLLEKVKANGLTMDSYKTLSEQSPIAALNILGINHKPSFGTGSPSSYATTNTEAVIQKRTGTRDSAYYKQLRKDMGVNKFYSDTKLVQAEIQDSAAQGAAFYT